ncbi:probable polygalacturonase At3g15720 [Punica granatum]|uniref:Probable polygalacturonase At3g15720 n=1 Tax=Punica granatum TaxID=22663 RepID=A0A6P8CYG0_PUNGR|nr:probable polygalacturonase At3g15720 [Punica granatum]
MPNLVAMLEILVAFSILCVAAVRSSDPQLFNVLSYGAIGDGAFGKAWDDLCGSTSNYVVLQIPNGKSFFLEPVNFKGPCKPSHLQVQIDGNLTAPTKPGDDNEGIQNWIQFVSLEGLVVNGSGSINGQGFAWPPHCKRPTALVFHNCNNLQILGLQSFNSPRNHISISSCNYVRLSNVYLSAPETSPNTDGIDISESTNIRIQESVISTGDDCVAINSGSSNINIIRITCGPGHGISIGSLGHHESYATVEDVHVSSCTFIGTQNGARIKTWQGGSGYARNITFKDIILESVNRSIIIDQFYCPHKTCPSERMAVKISSVRFAGFYGTSLDRRAISLNCSQTIGCTNINLDNVNITAATPSEKPYASCINAHGMAYNTSPPVPCLIH